MINQIYVLFFYFQLVFEKPEEEEEENSRTGNFENLSTNNGNKKKTCVMLQLQKYIVATMKRDSAFNIHNIYSFQDREMLWSANESPFFFLYDIEKLARQDL